MPGIDSVNGGSASLDSLVRQDADVARLAKNVLDDRNKLVQLGHSDQDVVKRGQLQAKLQRDYEKLRTAGGLDLLTKPAEIKARLDAAAKLEPPIKAGEMVIPW